VKQLSGKDFCRLRVKRGWQLKRINGSHHIHAVAGRIERVSVPVHGNKPLKIGLLRHFMKVAGIGPDEL